MKTAVKNINLGEGTPKVCVPIVAQTKAAILSEAAQLDPCVEIVEWRDDWFENGRDIGSVRDVLKELVPALRNRPLLFTFRTAKEGGNQAISAEDYAKLNKEAAATGLVDFIDVEMFTGDGIVKEIVESAHKAGVKVVMSSHDFEKTPPVDEMLYRLRKMQELGADVPKIAVMPKSRLDVLKLLEATVIMSETYADRPIITMSMSGMGVVSRLFGEVFGSALTFGAGSKASAPGQIAVKDLSDTLKLIHNSL